MTWFSLAIISYFILALVNLTDKFLLDKVLPSSKAYTFLVSIAGGIVILGFPWWHWPGWQLFSIDLIVGAIFPLALLLMYQALKTGEASKILVLIGASVPVFTLVLSYMFLGERFTANQWMALVGLIAGASLIAWLPAKENWIMRIGHWLGFNKPKGLIGIAEAIGAAILLAIFYTSSKFLYTAQNFVGAFIWLRLGSAVAALFMIIGAKSRKEIFHAIKKLRGKKAGLFFGNQLLAAVAFTLQNYALFLGSVSIVNALQGVQYAFLLIIGAVLTVFAPKVVKESISAGIIVQKIIAIIFIGLSLYLLVI